VRRDRRGLRATRAARDATQKKKTPAKNVGGVDLPVLRDLRERVPHTPRDLLGDPRLVRAGRRTEKKTPGERTSNHQDTDRFAAASAATEPTPNARRNVEHRIVWQRTGGVTDRGSRQKDRPT
jgi:hypothetical protein